MEKLQEFIKQYFSLLNLQKMPDAVKGHYDELIDKKDFPNKAVENWSKLMVDKTSKEWLDLPTLSVSKEEDKEKLEILYRDLLETFSNMYSHIGSLDNKAKDFVETYYGVNKLFNSPEITSGTKDQIKNLLKLLFSKDDVIDEADVMGYEERQILSAAFKGTKKLDAPDVKSAVYNVIKRIRDYNKQGYLTDEAKAKFYSLNLSNIQNSLQTNIEPYETDLSDLAKATPKIFETLFKEKKVLEAFKKYEPGEKIVSEQIDMALSETDYTGKINEDNYIAPKYKDAGQNLRQRIEKGPKNFYNDVLKKYVTLHRANMFVKPTSEAIIKAFDKAKIKPTDNLNVLIENADKISGELKGKEPFNSASHFKWLTDKLALYKKNGLADSMEGAIRWGYQMNRIVTELIKDAATEGKAEEAKTALEVLSVMQYGLFTSRTMDAINQTDFTLFSDSKLSWNKNEGIQTVTKGFDFVIDKGIEAVGYGITAAVNAARRIGTTFNNSGELKDLSDQRKIELADKKLDDEKKKKAEDRNDNKTIRDSNKVIKEAKDNIQKYLDPITGQPLGIRQAQKEIRQHEDNMRKKKEQERSLQQQMDELQDSRDEYLRNERIVQEYDNIPNRINEANDRRLDIKTEITDIQSIISGKTSGSPYKNPITGMPMTDAESEHYEQNLLANIDKLIEEDNLKQQEIQQLNDQYNDPQNENIRNQAKAQMLNLKVRNGEYLSAKTAHDRVMQEYHVLETDPRYVDLEKNMSKYSDAKKEKETAQADKRVRQENWNKWDENNKDVYGELMAYWDFLQSGNTKSLFHWSTKALQKKMYAGDMQRKLAEWNKQYTA